MGNERKSVKRYFWLKLKEEFFQDKEIKKLRRIAGGDTYTIIYLKLMLLSLKSDGRLYFDGIEDSFYEELALEIDEDPENVKITLMYLEKMGLVKLVSEDEMFLTQMDNLIVSESESAKRVRAHRARKKLLESSNGQLELPLHQEPSEFESNEKDDEALPCNGDVTKCNAGETNCNTYTDTDTNTKTDTKTEKKKKHFPPTVEEVAEYCRSRGNNIDAEEFVNYYDGCSWYRGKTKITNWKNVIITWEKRREKEGTFVRKDSTVTVNNGQLKRKLQ